MRRLPGAGAVALAVAAGCLVWPIGAGAATQLTGAMTADNAFFAYLGASPSSLGTLVGSGNSWPTSFALTASSLTAGTTYYLNIEAINYGGPGGLSAVLNLSDAGFHFANGTQTLTTDPANLAYWQGGYNDGNSSVTPQPWVRPTGGVLQDTSYGWGNVVGTANWIWPADSASSPGGAGGPCGSCTVDFSVAIIPIGAVVPEPAAWAVMLLGLAGLGGALRAARRGSPAREA